MRLDRTLGPLVVSWIESELVHGPGDVQGQRIELDDEQVRFVFGCYELDDRGRRVVRRAVFSRPKGRAKSELAAMITCAEALGPVRFRGWAEDGRPLGGPVAAPFIRVAATEEGQADNTYVAAKFMLEEGPVSLTAGLDVGLTRTYLPDGGKVEAITSAASSKEGGKETFVVFDETHLYVTPELHRLHSTLRRNLAKRRKAEPWSLEVTTMYAPNEESVAEHSHRYATAVAEGRISDAGLLFDHRSAPAGFAFDDDDALRAALVEVYGDAAEWMDLERLIAEARDPDSDESDFRRYFLNQPAVRSNAFLAEGEWDALADPGRVVADRAEITMGFDGSFNNDSTALVGCTVEEVPHLFVIAAWEKPPGQRGWVVPREEVHTEVEKAYRLWSIREQPLDRAKWYDEASAWADRYGSPPVVEFPQTRPRMAEASTALRSAVRNRALTHDGDPRLARHFANVVTKPHGADQVFITKDSPHSSRKIDLAVAAVMAYRRAVDPELTSVESPYERRDLLVL